MNQNHHTASAQVIDFTRGEILCDVGDLGQVIRARKPARLPVVMSREEGTGARDGLRKCFRDTAGLTNAEVIQVMAERAGDEFDRLGMKFQNLWGRSLQLIDCQNVFCEVSKYARVAHPDGQGESGRTRIKQKFAPRTESLPQWYPPKWNICPPVAQQQHAADGAVRRR